MGGNVIALLLVLVIWVLYQLTILIFSKDKEIINLVITVVFVLAISIMIITGNHKELLFEVTSYIVYFYILLYSVYLGLRKHFKSEVSDDEFYELEQKLDQVVYDSELLRQRFISTIEILNDGMSFRDSNGEIFGTDKYINYLGIESNIFSLDEFEKIVVKEDLIHYKNVLEKTTKKSPIYKVDYRVKKGNDFVWIKEVGKRIVLEKKVSYISVVKRMDIKEFPESEIDVLNGLPGYKKMYDEMHQLQKKKMPYNLVVIQLTNIPQINEKFGRDVGDLMMGEYLKKFRYNFIKDQSSLFRISGITFGLLVKDSKKIEFLERALTGGGELMNLDMVFGGITQTLYPNLGISESPYKGKSIDLMIEEALTALNVSLKDSTNLNYCFYDRI